MDKCLMSRFILTHCIEVEKEEAAAAAAAAVTVSSDTDRNACSSRRRI